MKYVKLIKIKKIFIYLAVTVMLFTSSVQAYVSLSGGNPTYATTSSNVNFRYNPSTSSVVIKVLPKGTNVKIIGSIDDFNIVQLGSNEVGVVSKAYLKASTEVPKGASSYTAIDEIVGTINEDNVNYRRGPGTSFSKIGSLKKNTVVTVLGYIGDWYLVVTKDGNVGMVINKYLSLGGSEKGGEAASDDANVNLVFQLINKARTENGLPSYKLGATLPKIAELKAKDMVANSYFSHNSPTYGSPFDMISDYGVGYKSAGENIAGNPDLAAAVEAWLLSDTHKQNILSDSFNYIGIGVEKSDVYGYIVDVLFVEQ